MENGTLEILTSPSHQPPLYVLCHFCLISRYVQQKSTTCTNSNSKKTHPNHKVMTRNPQTQLRAQMKAYDTPMKEFNLFCRTFHLRRLFPTTLMRVLYSQVNISKAQIHLYPGVVLLYALTFWYLYRGAFLLKRSHCSIENSHQNTMRLPLQYLQIIWATFRSNKKIQL